MTLEGIEKAQEEAGKLTKEAVELLEQLPGDSRFLKELFLSLMERRK